MNNKLNHRNKQRGLATIDKLAAVTGLVIAILWLLSQIPKADYAESLALLQMQVGEIKSASKTWRKRGTYSGVSMAALCQNNLIDDSYCGGSSPGQNVNAFGGNINISSSASNPLLLTIVITIPNDEDKVNDIAATLAGLTRENCVSVNGCNTISVSGTSITLTV